ncbi:hypothetical protein [Paracoccus benzoatiresistens]|uniref:Uncharacterized protein n=1 Tax=Paracoccus benzoatiresistens TaxID=2997341 RepID=A0ABT4J978_9RHOB|nr:hypothetical protein [Paracoccus sp. EF6]MCZ0963245.1 hypothetical protein [Paracoccus sp. EF6]
MTVAATGLAPRIIDVQLNQRTDLTQPRLGQPQHDSILAAGLALQAAGVIGQTVDVQEVLWALLDDRLPTV